MLLGVIEKECGGRRSVIGGVEAVSSTSLSSYDEDVGGVVVEGVLFERPKSFLKGLFAKGWLCGSEAAASSAASSRMKARNSASANSYSFCRDERRDLGVSAESEESWWEEEGGGGGAEEEGGGERGGGVAESANGVGDGGWSWRFSC